MSEKNIVYYYDICLMSPEDISKKLGISIEKVWQVLGKTPNYRLLYVPRKRYNGWINGR